MGAGGKRRRWPIAVAVVVVGMLVGVSVALGLRAWLTAPPHEVGVGETVAHFRATANETASVDGVYVYDTSGQESIDALGGAAHSYPAVTALTVMSDGCGLSMTWAPLDGRSEQLQVCASGGGLAMPTTVTVHTFFRQTISTAFTCEDSWWVPPPGVTTWTSTCENAGRLSKRTGRVVGIEPVTVDGQEHQAIHAQWLDQLSQGSDGTVTTDVWIDQQTALLVREHAVTDSHNDSPVGRVKFEETLDLRLRSAAPLR